MTRTKLWRISLAAILGFGWLLLSPAYSDDPLSLAAQEIQDLNSKVNNLEYQDDFISYIDIAEQKYEFALLAKNNLNTVTQSYNDALQQKTIALEEKNSAQISVDNQTSIVANAQNNLDVASINLSTTQIQYPVQGTPGLNAYLYNCWNPWNSYNNAPQFGCGANPISMGPWNSMWWNFGGGGPTGLYDDYQIHLVGYIKQTQHWTPQFRTCGDDGMVIIINGVTVASDWYDRGGGCGISNGYYMPDNDWVPIEIWWYENGGGAWGEAQWNIGNGFVTIPSNVLSTEIPFVAPELIAAQEDYNNKLSIYNQEVQTLQTLQSNLTLADQNLTLADQNLTSSLTAKNNAEIDYNNSVTDLNTAISDAWDYYNKQLKIELQAAIAKALANQPVPEVTQEPEPSPTPLPSPDQSIIPSPEPTSEPDNDQDVEPTPTPESSPSEDESSPSPEASPKPTPTPDQTETIEIEPSPSPSENKIDDNNTTEQVANLIADLTNKNTLAKLTPEQKEVLSETLGIKTEEIAVVAELAKTNEAVAKALEQFSERSKENADSPMPYTLADATTELQAEAFLADPIGALTNIDLEKVLDPSQWGKDMTDDQREKAQEVIIPVIIASNLVAAAMTRRI